MLEANAEPEAERNEAPDPQPSAELDSHRDPGKPREPEVPVIDDPPEPEVPKTPEMPPPMPDPPDVVARRAGL